MKEHLAAVREKHHEHDFSEANGSLLAALHNSKNGSKLGKVASNLSVLVCLAGIPEHLGEDFSETEYSDDDLPSHWSSSSEVDHEIDSDIESLVYKSGELDNGDDFSPLIANFRESPETLFTGIFLLTIHLKLILLMLE